MIKRENILLVPGTIQYVKNYGSYDGLDIWMRSGHKKIPTNARCFIGHSLGASYILDSCVGPENKFIFINPLVKKRNIAHLFLRWIMFHISEGFPKEKAVPMRHWIYAFKRMLFLLKVDVIGQMCKIPRENVVIIRGIEDKFFCDDEDVEILRKNNFQLIEVEAGHDWNENVAKEVANIFQNPY
jgi:hypothetical protein